MIPELRLPARTSTRVALYALAPLAIWACDPSVGIDAPPVAVRSIPPQVAVVGTPFTFDATLGGTAFDDPGKRDVRYAVTLSPDGHGLVATDATIAGTPSDPGVVAVRAETAVDARGDSAVISFPIVIFSDALSAPVLPGSALAYSDLRAPLPAHFVSAPGGAALLSDNTPPSNPTTDNGATLGRVLFYDTRLSRNDAVSCASCHHQRSGFGDTARFGAGVDGTLTSRRVMALANARFFQTGRAFWDLRASSYEAQALMPIQNAHEMGLSLPDLVTKLEVTGYYPPLFQAAFGSDDITAERVARALAQFVRSLISARAPVDSIFLGGGPPNPAVLPAAAQLGRELFEGKARCGQCHRTTAMIVDQMRNIGLDSVTIDVGAGQGRMKAPSLRNIAIRPPYMHDGRFATLQQVVSFYDSGIQANADLDERLRAPDGSPLRLGLSPDERDAIVAYLRTFTDSSFLSDSRFSDPFPR